ncbi:MAG: zinc ribbon domain-containing protein [Methanopyri archaeon]|jgi:putative transposase|nr:zinc ribbon domain-containing protein [Methanopyri archaeon]
MPVSCDAIIGVLHYWAVTAGAEQIEMDPRNTSRMCNQCGSIIPKALSIRVHRCSHCGFEAHRDVNVTKGIHARAGRARSHAS